MIFHDMIHRELEVYVDDLIVKSRLKEGLLQDLKKVFERLHKYQLKLNPAKCTFGVTSGKLMGFLMSQKGIEIDSSKIKAILEMPVPSGLTEVRSFLGKLNFISRFISQMTQACDPIYRLLRKNAPQDGR